jgi:hypothetical protein
VDFDLNTDQQTLQNAFQQLANRFKETPTGQADYVLEAGDFEAALTESGFLDVATEEGFGALEAVLLIEALSGSPRSVELAASALILPLLLKGQLPRPVALARAPLTAPVRFLTPGKGTLLVDDGSAIRRVNVADISVEAVEAPFNYPISRAKNLDLSKAEKLNVDLGEFRRLWQLGVAAEIVGSMAPALDMTTEYVKQRQQFGRPLGTFQTIQHRLAECHVLIEGTRLLTYEAASSGSPSSAALALSYAQDAASRVVYETQQFHGAIGLTLEYPLHYWTYRLRFLMGELGGSSTLAKEAANDLWSGANRIPDTFLGGAAFN